MCVSVMVFFFLSDAHIHMYKHIYLSICRFFIFLTNGSGHRTHFNLDKCTVFTVYLYKIYEETNTSLMSVNKVFNFY